MIEPKAKIHVDHFEVSLRDPDQPSGEMRLVFTQSKPTTLNPNMTGFDRPLSAFQTAALQSSTLYVEHPSVVISALDVLRCACFAQARLVESLRTRLSLQPVPHVVVEMNGGVIGNVISDMPVKVLMLDEDIEGADEDGIVEIDGGDWYLCRFDLSEPGSVNAPRVANVLKQVSEGEAVDRPSES